MLVALEQAVAYSGFDPSDVVYWFEDQRRAFAGNGWKAGDPISVTLRAQVLARGLPTLSFFKFQLELENGSITELSWQAKPKNFGTSKPFISEAEAQERIRAKINELDPVFDESVPIKFSGARWDTYWSHILNYTQNATPEDVEGFYAKFGMMEWASPMILAYYSGPNSWLAGVDLTGDWCIAVSANGGFRRAEPQGWNVAPLPAPTRWLRPRTPAPKGYFPQMGH
jgi:hypothetical protein